LQILNTILGGGAGIVPLPHAMHLAGGFRTGLTILMLCGALSAYTACAIISASCLVNEKTYESVARRTIGRAAAMCVRLLLIAFAFGSGVVALSIFADVAQAWLGSRSACIVCAGGMVAPIITFVRRIEQLAPVSVFASSLVLVFLLFALWTYAVSPPEATSDVARRAAAAGAEAGSLSGVLQAVSVINLSFNTHFNLLPLFFALPVPSERERALSRHKARWRQRQRMYALVCIATALAFAIYAAIGVLGCSSFGGRPSGNTLADYATLGAAGRTINNAIALAQLATLPLLVHEGVREAASLLANVGGASVSGTHELTASEAGGGSGRTERLGGVLWCTLMTLVATHTADTSAALALVAALCGAPLMSVLPVWMLLKAGDDSNGMRSPLRMALNAALLAVGTTATAACSLSALGLI